MQWEATQGVLRNMVQTNKHFLKIPLVPITDGTVVGYKETSSEATAVTLGERWCVLD